MFDGKIIMDWIAPVFSEDGATMQRLRYAAANLSNIGWSEHPDYRAEQVFLRILRMPLVGVNHEERAMLALAVASRHAAIGKIVSRWQIDRLLSDDRLVQACSIGLSMRLAYTLTGGAISLLEASRLKRDGNRLFLMLPVNANILVGDAVARRFRALAKVLKCEHEIVLLEDG